MLNKKFGHKFFGLNNTFSGFNRQVAGRYAGREYLDERYFLITILAAMMLHVAGMYVWHMMPATQVIDIPVQALNIKLGDGEALTAEDLKTIQPNADNYDEVETVLTKIVHDQMATTLTAKSAGNSGAVDKDAVSRAFDKAMNVPGNEAALIQE